MFWPRALQKSMNALFAASQIHSGAHSSSVCAGAGSCCMTFTCCSEDQETPASALDHVSTLLLASPFVATSRIVTPSGSRLTKGSRSDGVLLSTATP